MPRLGQLQVDLGLDVVQAAMSLGSLDGFDWTRITPDDPGDGSVTESFVMSASYQWGRDRFIHGDFETGTATLVLDNDTGEWSPESGVNWYGGVKLRPGMLVRLSYQVKPDDLTDWMNAYTSPTGWTVIGDGATRDLADSETWEGSVDGAAWVNHGSDNTITVLSQDGNTGEGPRDGMVRFLGRIYNIEDRYDEGGRGAVTVVTVVDLLADLAQYHPEPLSSPQSAELTSDRWSFVRVEALNDGGMAGDTQVGIYDVEASDLPANYLEEARVAARAEGGAVYADHGGSGGRLVFKAANWLINDPRSATVQQYVGTGNVGIVAAQTEYSLARIFNTMVYSNTATTVTVTDPSSIAEYSARTLTRSILNNSNTDLDTIADRDLALLKDAKLVINQVTIKPGNVFETLWARQVTVGDLLEVTVQNRGWSYTQRLHVSGVSESWDAGTDDWTLTLRLDSRDGDTVLT
jgi:hypothetical protein